MLELLAVLDADLTMKTYLVGHQVTIADIMHIPLLQRIFQTILIEKERNNFKNVVRYYNHLTSLPFYTQWFGAMNTRTCTK